MSNEPEPIYYALNVSLFAFTLQSGSYLDLLELINESPHNFKHKYEKLLKDNFSSKLDFSKPFPELRQDFPKSDNYDLLDSQKKGTRQYFLRSSLETNQNQIQPKPLYRLLVYPQKLSDSYALLINVFRPQIACCEASAYFKTIACFEMSDGRTRSPKRCQMGSIL